MVLNQVLEKKYKVLSWDEMEKIYGLGFYDDINLSLHYNFFRDMKFLCGTEIIWDNRTSCFNGCMLVENGEGGILSPLHSNALEEILWG